MRETPAWRRYLRLFGSNPAADAEDEIAFHLTQRVDDLVRDGATPEEARARAAREFGNVREIRQELHTIGQRRLQREQRAAWWESAWQDLRFAARTLRKSLGFTGIVIGTLALGIGGTTAMFSVVQAVLLAPLPYAAPGQLVRLYMQEPRDPGTRTFVTGVGYRDLRDHASAFEQIAATYTYRETGRDLAASSGAPQRLRVLEVTHGYFDVLRAGALRGPGFRAADEVGARRVVLSDELWRARFQGDMAILGRAVQLSGEPYEVAGIAPPGLEDPIVGKVDAWLPYDLAGNTVPGNFSLSAIGRLRANVTLDQARAELEALSRQTAARMPSAIRINTFGVLPLKEDLVAPSRGPLSLLLLAVGLVLLVACVNVANLFLVRSTGRVRELAIRAALGAGRVRIARQLLAESLLLSAFGGLGGLALAAVALDVLRALGDGIPRLERAGLDPIVLAFSAATTVVTGIAFGMMPAIRFASIQPDGALREQARSVTSGGKQGRLRSVLAAAQLALALTLLVSAGVLIASFMRLQAVDLGIQVDRVLTFELNLPAARYDAPRRAAFQEQLAREIARLPGVRAAGGTSRLPATGPYHAWATRIDSGPLAGTNASPEPNQRIVSGNVFAALGIPLRAGRVFDDTDDASAPGRVVVSADFARLAFPGMPLADVIGQRIAPNEEPRTIIGIVGDVALDPQGHVAPIVYQAHRQFAAERNWPLIQTVSGDLPPEQLLSAVRGVVSSLDAQLVVHHAAAMTDVVGRGVRRERFALVLMGAFATAALILAALGLYGVLAYTVRQRTREMGIRLALGATVGHVRALVLRQALKVLGVGALFGLAGALALGRWISTLAFNVRPWDARVLASTTMLLMLVGLIAAWAPARRAARVDPKIAMQDE